MNNEVISLKEIVGEGYSDFWHFKGRYRVCKGSRASKKSKTTALNLIVRMIEYPLANILVVRKVYSTLKDSCYTELCWAIHRLKMDNFFECKTSPLEIMYIPTGQKIYFRGLDDPLKITSITVKTGSLCWLWIEEAYEITNEDDFNMLDESIRGSVDKSIFKQITITLNPWNERHWIKARFFDVIDSNIMAKSTNYMCNEWLDESDLKVFEDMKKNNPRRYRVAGLDFGYTNDPTALFCGFINTEKKEVYVFDELYKKGMSNEAIYEAVVEMGYKKEKIRADSAEPKSIDRLRTLGLKGIRPARKGKDSINNGIDFLQDYKIYVSPKCQNFITEISNYTWDKDLNGKMLNKPVDSFNHLMDAMRYAVEEISNGEMFSFE